MLPNLLQCDFQIIVSSFLCMLGPLRFLEHGLIGHPHGSQMEASFESIRYSVPDFAQDRPTAQDTMVQTMALSLSNFKLFGNLGSAAAMVRFMVGMS